MASKIRNIILLILLLCGVGWLAFEGFNYFFKDIEPEEFTQSRKGSASLSSSDDYKSQVSSGRAIDSEDKASDARALLERMGIFIDRDKQKADRDSSTYQSEVRQNELDGLLSKKTDSFTENSSEGSRLGFEADSNASTSLNFNSSQNAAMNSTALLADEDGAVQNEEGLAKDPLKVGERSDSRSSELLEQENLYQAIDAGPVEDPKALPPVEYSSAKKIARNSNVVRGSSQQGKSGTSSGAALSSLEVYSDSAQDGMISFGFVRDTARLLVDEYWPKGTHPNAIKQSISTAGMMTFNNRYGIEMFGLLPDGSTQRSAARSRILNYALMPSMIDGLYNLYSERFISLMNAEARAKIRLKNSKSYRLSNEDIAEMYNVYAQMSRSGSAAIKTYLNSPNLKLLVRDYIGLEKKAEEAGKVYAKAKGEKEVTAKSIPFKVSSTYEGLVRERENSKKLLASAMKSGSLPGLDESSLVYIACWLDRRDINQEIGLRKLSEALDKLSRRLSFEGEKYKSLEED